MSSTASQRTKTDDVPYGRSREDVDFWMGCVGAPMVLVEKGTLHVRRANSNAAVLFGLGLEAFENLPIEDLVGREASILLSQIWSVAPIGVPAAVSDIDGLRVTLEDGSVIHFRPSGNAPEMRCYVEAESEAAAARLLAAGLERIRAWVTNH